MRRDGAFIQEAAEIIGRAADPLPFLDRLCEACRPRDKQSFSFYVPSPPGRETRCCGRVAWQLLAGPEWPMPSAVEAVRDGPLPGMAWGLIEKV
jgi:hypothetical protein